MALGPKKESIAVEKLGPNFVAQARGEVFGYGALALPPQSVAPQNAPAPEFN